MAGRKSKAERQRMMNEGRAKLDAAKGKTPAQPAVATPPAAIPDHPNTPQSDGGNSAPTGQNDRDGEAAGAESPKPQAQSPVVPIRPIDPAPRTQPKPQPQASQAPAPEPETPQAVPSQLDQLARAQDIAKRAPNRPIVPPRIAKAPKPGEKWDLSEVERKAGYVRPCRRTYMHVSCRQLTTVTQDTAETFARKPRHFKRAYCAGCRNDFPVTEFVWEGTHEPVGS